jgi:hypothetical protein
LQEAVRVMRFNWKFDEQKQVLTAPSGYSVTVREIAEWLQDRVHGRADLTGEWQGWKVRGKSLIPPRGGKNSPVLTPREALEILGRTKLVALNREIEAPIPEPRQPRLYIVR